MRNNLYNIGSCLDAQGLTDQDNKTLRQLVDVYQSKISNNQKRVDYYRDRVTVKNLGIAVPEQFNRKLNTDVGWAAKAVDMLAERSIFDGFAVQGEEDTVLDEIMAANDIGLSYEMATPSELVYSCGFWTVTKGIKYPIIRYYNAENGAAIWDYDKRQIKAGFVVTDYALTKNQEEVPVCIVLHTDKFMTVIQRASVKDPWTATRQAHMIGRPLMEPMCYKPSDDRPFGKSVISKTTMSIIDEMKRELLRSSLHSELFTSPSKYVLGAANVDEDSAAAIKRLLKYNEVFVAERDENGDLPQIGQLNATSMQPHIEAMQTLAKRMAAEASIPLNSLGIIHDNPSSAEALRASMEDLTMKAEQLNRTNGKALRNVARLALAAYNNVAYDSLTEQQKAIDVCFKNPSQPTMSSVADAMMKIATTLPWITDTEVYLEALGFDDAQRSRLMAEKRQIEAKKRIEQTIAPIPVQKEVENGANDNQRTSELVQEQPERADGRSEQIRKE